MVIDPIEIFVVFQQFLFELYIVVKFVVITCETYTNTYYSKDAIEKAKGAWVSSGESKYQRRLRFW